MKQFKPFDKVLYRLAKEFCWIPSFYQMKNGYNHFVIDTDNSISNSDIISYEGNEHLVGTCDEPEEIYLIAKGELILCSNIIDNLCDGRGSIVEFKCIKDKYIYTNLSLPYEYCIPMSKYDLNNLAETKKWVLTVKNGNLIKVNK